MDAMHRPAGPFRPDPDIIKTMDRVAVPLVAGGLEAEGVVAWYRVNPDSGEQILGVQLDDDPRTIIPAPASTVRVLRSPTLGIGAALLLAVWLAGCGAAPADPDDRLRAMVRAYWYSLPDAALP